MSEEVKLSETTDKPLTKEDLGNAIEEFLAAKDKPNKFLELFFCRRTLSVLAFVITLVAKHYGLPIDNTELLGLGTTIGALVVGHSLRPPGITK